MAKVQRMNIVLRQLMFFKDLQWRGPNWNITGFQLLCASWLTVVRQFYKAAIMRLDGQDIESYSLQFCSVCYCLLVRWLRGKETGPNICIWSGSLICTIPGGNYMQQLFPPFMCFSDRLFCYCTEYGTVGIQVLQWIRCKEETGVSVGGTQLLSDERWKAGLTELPNTVVVQYGYLKLNGKAEEMLIFQIKWNCFLRKVVEHF